MLIDLSLLFALILLNGAFSMSETALVRARRARLVQLAEDGYSGASTALTLSADPTRFLSSVQVGITCVGILSGAIGEATVAPRLRTAFEQVPALVPYAQELSLVVMVGGLTYVSLILGELVPKRLAIGRPESIASLVARPMQVVATLLHPMVSFLSFSTNAILRLFGLRDPKEPVVTPEEINVLIEQGTEEGVFEPSEQQMVTNILNLDERRIGAVITPRSEIAYLDVKDSWDRNREKLAATPHSIFPLCNGGLEHVLGFVRSSRLLEQLAEERPVDLVAIADPPLFVPETITLMTLLEHFKRTHVPVALVIDEFGDVEGLVSLTDVISSIVGDLPGEPGEEPMVIQREDGSWLVDGALDVDSMLRALGADSLADEEERQRYHTLGGLTMFALGRVPHTGDVFEKGEFRFEVMDMDGNRVDRVLVSRRT